MQTVDFLIVEDELAPLMALETRLESLNYTFHSATNACDMWLFLSDPETEVRAILLDVSISYTADGETNWNAGVEIAKQLGENYPLIPVILFTGHGESYPEEEAEKLSNVVSFFRKPFPGLRFRNALANVIEGRLGEGS